MTGATYVELNPHDVINDETDEYYDGDLAEWRAIRGYSGQTAYELAHSFRLRRRLVDKPAPHIEVKHHCGRMRDVGEKCWWCGGT